MIIRIGHTGFQSVPIKNHYFILHQRPRTTNTATLPSKSKICNYAISELTVYKRVQNWIIYVRLSLKRYNLDVVKNLSKILIHKHINTAVFVY